MTNIIFSVITIVVTYSLLIGLTLFLFKKSRNSKSRNTLNGNFSFRIIMMFFWGSLGVLSTTVTLSLMMVIPQQYTQILNVMDLIDESISIENQTPLNESTQ